MPYIKFTEVRTFSSEDPNFPANNLLKLDTYYKWKSESGRNEKQEYVVLKLEKLSSIHSIDIGNENAAFIEVLVSRGGEEFKVLLVSSSFMSPLESRNGTNTNRVRMFSLDKLNKITAEQKWDTVKIVCTQPFSKNVQYGLTFVKVYSPEEKASARNETKLGNFSIREDDSEEDSLSIGSFFSKRKERDSPLSGAAAIRAASKIASQITEKSDTVKRLAEEENTLSASNVGFYQLKKKIKESPAPSQRDSPSSKSEQVPKKAEKQKNVPDVTPSKNKDRKHSKKESKNSDTSTPRNSSKTLKKHLTRPFNQLMSDVVFVLSGYQNPQRSNIRDSLVEMGGKYKSDWGQGCTHLICAFKNTPKYQSVKGKGKIVNEKWIEDAYKKKIRFPWRRYSLEKTRGDESEEEIWATELCPDSQNGKETKMSERLSDAEGTVESEDTDEEIQRVIQNNERDSRDKNNAEDNSKKEVSRKEKTRDRIIPSNNKRSESPKSPEEKMSDDDYEADTDVEEENHKRDTREIPLPPLKEIFKQKNFFIYGSLLDESKKKCLSRYIVAFQGNVLAYMNEEVDFVITDDSWDENFDSALEENPALQFVKSHWIWKCCESEKMVPPQPYLVVPKDES